jgi:hypothetical protein
MVKYVQCIRRRPDLSVEEFRAGWERYSERLRALALELGARRATVATTLESPLNEHLVAARGSAEPFDGVAEVVWRNGAQAFADAARPATAARLAGLRALQEQFADVASSSYFFTHELELLDEGG